MEREKLTEEIRKVIASVLKHENFQMKDELTANDVQGWDSLTHTDILTQIEDHFNIRFKLKEISKLTDLGSLIELVQSKL